MADSVETRINRVLRKWHGRVMPGEVFEKLVETYGIGTLNLEHLELGNFIATRLPDRSGYEILDRSLVRLQFHLPVLIQARAKYGLYTAVSHAFLRDVIQWYWQASNDSLIPIPLESGELNYVLTRLSQNFGGVLEISLSNTDGLCCAIEEAQVEWVLVSLE